MINQTGILGCSIKEISLDDLEPYNCYDLSRFRFKEEDIEKLLELMKDCSEFNDFNTSEITELLKDRELILLD